MLGEGLGEMMPCVEKAAVERRVGDKLGGGRDVVALGASSSTSMMSRFLPLALGRLTAGGLFAGVVEEELAALPEAARAGLLNVGEPVAVADRSLGA